MREAGVAHVASVRPKAHTTLSGISVFWAPEIRTRTKSLTAVHWFVSEVGSWQLPNEGSTAFEADAKAENIHAVSWNTVEDGGTLHITNIQGVSLPRGSKGGG